MSEGRLPQAIQNVHYMRTEESQVANKMFTTGGQSDFPDADRMFTICAQCNHQWGKEQ